MVLPTLHTKETLFERKKITSNSRLIKRIKHSLSSNVMGRNNNIDECIIMHAMFVCLFILFILFTHILISHTLLYDFRNKITEYYHFRISVTKRP